MQEKRSSFSGGFGFVLAAAASAVGLGNLWRFPYLAAQHGGGIFIFVYLILVLTFGFSLVLMEIAIGRKTKMSSIRAFTMLHKKAGFLGFVAMLVPMIILPYYCVIGGWVIKYMVAFLTGQGKAAADTSYFGGFVGATFSPLITFLIFLGVTSIIVALGVEKGVERASKWLMPILIIISLGVSIYIFTIPHALDGIKYYLLPDFSKFSIKTVCAAMGQLFFSLSIAMGILISYGSYVRDDVDISKSVNHIEIFDTSIALLSGFMIVPAVYVFGGEAGLATGGPGLMFKTLPQVFERMTMGGVIGAAFFILVFFAAITSSISVMEAVVSNLIDRFKMSRLKAVIVVVCICLVLGTASSLGNGVWSHIKIWGMDFLTFFDFLSNSLMMPILALGTCILVGWILGTKIIEDEVTKNGEKFGRVKIFRVMIRYIAPVMLVMILVFYTLAQFEIIKY